MKKVIAIGNARARRGGEKLPLPGKGKTSVPTGEKSEHDEFKGQSSSKKRASDKRAPASGPNIRARQPASQDVLSKHGEKEIRFTPTVRTGGFMNDDPRNPKEKDELVMTPGGPRPRSAVKQVGQGQAVTRINAQNFAVVPRESAGSGGGKSALSEPYVVTPGGFRPKSLVHLIEPGHVLDGFWRSFKEASPFGERGGRFWPNCFSRRDGASNARKCGGCSAYSIG